MSILQPHPIHNTNQFDWDGATKIFSADASTLGWPVGAPALGRVYDDAADEGFTLVSAKTGKAVVVACHDYKPSLEHSGGWSKMAFCPADAKMRHDFMVVVWNP